MPNPGQANNAMGINSFSGPMGQKEPAYGDVQRLKILTAIAPPGTPSAIGAPKRAKRAAIRGRKALPNGAAPVGPPAPAAIPATDNYHAMMSAFWQQLATEPGASPLIQQYAAQVTNGTLSA